MEEKVFGLQEEVLCLLRIQLVGLELVHHFHGKHFLVLGHLDLEVVLHHIQELQVEFVQHSWSVEEGEGNPLLLNEPIEKLRQLELEFLLKHL